MNPTTLKNCIQIDADEEELLNDIFEDELKEAITIVNDDMDKDNKDSIDTLTQQSIAKKGKLCENNHIKYEVKLNRKICDRNYCKANLKNKDEIQENNEIKINKNEIDKAKVRANMYLNVPNVHVGDDPQELAVGALAINPNKRDRVGKVLDAIQEAAGMKNNYTVNYFFRTKKS